MPGALDATPTPTPSPRPAPTIDPGIVAPLLSQHRMPPADAPTAARPALPARSGRYGSTPEAAGTTFRLYAADATAVRVVLFDAAGAVSAEWDLVDHRDNAFSGFVPGVHPGQRYGYRVDGPWEPGRGLRHNPHKVLLDPHGRAVTGTPAWGDATLAHDPAEGSGVMSELDSAGSVPHSVVIDDAFDWGNDVRPHIPDGRTVIYETHVRGMTVQHPGVPAAERGTYLGLASPAVTSHLRRMGVTSVELLPVQAFLDREGLLKAGLRQYWGYDTIGFFAPEQRYARALDPEAQVREFKEMVKRLHAAGLEVILDVVYNHTPEGGDDSPSICFRGVDNRTYYQLQPASPYHQIDMTGCGDTVNAANPQTLRMIMESLRYWVEEMHVDGFRFDVAPALARRDGGAFDRWSAFLAAVHQDPVLTGVKLIAEAWDCGPDPYHVGDFPAGWGEWNGRFRDTVRDFWRGWGAGVGELATRICGSEDIYGRDARGPMASINFVTCHDGFTLLDNVSYNTKHNLANGENNRDGVDENRSWNHGVEGPTTDAAINDLRRRQQRNMLATLYLALGRPMLLGGDEIGRTQGGNNNAYNQDNATSWFDWLNADPELADFVARLGHLRQTQAVLQRTTFLEGRTGPGAHDRDSAWLRPDGAEMTESNWNDHAVHSVGLLLNGAATGERRPDGTPLTGDTLLTLYHGDENDTVWTLPGDWGDWEVVLDTANPGEAEGARRVGAGETVRVAGRSVVVLRARSASN